MTDQTPELLFTCLECEQHFNVQKATTHCPVCGWSARPTPAGRPSLVQEILQADTEPPEASFDNAEDMLKWLDAPSSERPVPQVREALALAIKHIEHMAAFITEANCDYHCGTYSFESLGEDMPGIREALTARPSDAAVGSDDLVRRLQTWPFESGNLVNTETSFSLINEAIAEIKRLRALPPDEPARVTPSTVGGEALNIETIQILLDLLNPLHGTFDVQNYEEKYRQNFDAPDDAEYNVNITARMERDLTQAVLILEDRKRQSPTIASEKECGKDKP